MNLCKVASSFSNRFVKTKVKLFVKEDRGQISHSCDDSAERNRNRSLGRGVVSSVISSYRTTLNRLSIEANIDR
jgi:hypothetical protein